MEARVLAWSGASGRGIEEDFQRGETKGKADVINKARKSYNAAAERVKLLSSATSTTKNPPKVFQAPVPNLS